MSTKQYWLVCILAGICVLLAIEKYRVTRVLSRRQDYINQLNQVVNGSLVDRLGPNNVQAVLSDVGSLSVSNAQVRRVLNEAGFTYTPATNAVAAPATNPVPTATTNLTLSPSNSPSL